jgi:hypothetical protein
VLITITILVPPTTSTAAVTAAVNSAMGTPALAVALLSAVSAVTTVTVGPPPSGTGGDGGGGGLSIGVVAGAAAAGATVLVPLSAPLARSDQSMASPPSPASPHAQVVLVVLAVCWKRRQDGVGFEASVERGKLRYDSTKPGGMAAALRSRISYGERSGVKDDPLKWAKADAPKGTLNPTESTIGPLKRIFKGRSAALKDVQVSRGEQPRFSEYSDKKEFSATQQTATQYI